MKRIHNGFLLVIFGTVFAVCSRPVADLFLEAGNFLLVVGLGFLLSGILLIIFSIKNQSSADLTELQKIDQMDGNQFEQYLSLLFVDLGFAVTQTKKSHDYGADLILENETTKIVVQAKRYQGKVPINAVSEAAAARLHYDADEAWIVTNSYFTQSALDLALSNSVKLVSRNELSFFCRQRNSKDV